MREEAKAVMQIGEKIKQLRLQHRLTQEELANRCELSKGFISQLERDLTSPSIATLMDILECLGTNLKDFFSESAEEKLVFGPQDYPVKEDDSGSVTWLVPSAQKNSMEPILLELSPGGKSPVLPPLESEEFGYVLSGRIKLVNLDAGKVYTVKKGQTFYVKGSFSHCLKNDSAQPARVLWICTPPIF